MGTKHQQHHSDSWVDTHWVAFGTSLVDISVIIPTWNEQGNIGPLLQELGAVLSSRAHEVVVVDDGSPDGTAEVVEEYRRENQNHDVTLVRRAGKRGLAGAILDGVDVARGSYIVMMDADFSHHPSFIPQMLEEMDKGYDVVVGSRYIDGTLRSRGWPLIRRASSQFAINIARLMLQLDVSDVTSGFVCFRRSCLQNLPTHFSNRSFKLLLEVLTVRPDLRVTEFPIFFANRGWGKSKFGVREMVLFGILCCRLWWYRKRTSD